MATSAFSGPVVSFGASPAEQVAGSNPNRSPSLFDQGVALLDPRVPFGYQPGGADTSATYGWLGATRICVINQVPSAISATNIAASAVPVAGTAFTLVSASGGGITVGTSITNAATGATVTGLLAIDTAMAGVAMGQAASIKMWDPTKAIARNVRITSVGDDRSGTFLVSGYDVYGYPMSERITGSNATVASGAKAFKYIASVVPAGTLSGSAITIGTGDVIGLPIRSDYFGECFVNYPDGTVITATTGYTAAVTTSPATTTTGDVRGTYALQTASDGSRRLVVYVSPSLANIVSATGLFGVTQA